VDAINQPERVPVDATGFRFLGATTPFASSNGGAIREVGEIAHHTPMSRIGVLRMDVDGLGQLFSRQLEPATLANICTLSASLDIFFAGWLNVLCNRVQRLEEDGGTLAGKKLGDKRRGDLLYTIYSGGDDLFIIGAWDRLPILADLIRKDFTRYCAENPAFHLSAGIAIESAHFPLYQLGQYAADALNGVKALKPPPDVRTIRGYDKSALSLFGHIIPWERFQSVRESMQRLTATEQEPSALLGRLRDLTLLDHAERERIGRGLAVSERAVLGLTPPDPFGERLTVVGRAKWRGLVALRRSIEQYRGTDSALMQLLQELEVSLLEGSLTPHLPLVVRWADYLWRPSNDRGDDRRNG